MKDKNVVIVADYPFIDGGSHKVAIEDALLLQDDFNVWYFSFGMEDGKSVDSHLANSNVKVITHESKSMKTSGYKLSSMISAVYNVTASRWFTDFLVDFDTSNTIIIFQTWGRIASSSVINVARKKGFKSILMMHDYLQVCACGTLFNYRKRKICETKPYSPKCFFCRCISEPWPIKVGKFLRGSIQNHILRKSKNLKFAYISDFSYKVTREKSHFIDDSNSIYIPNPVIQDHAFSQRVRCEENESFLFIGSITPLKGVDLFCKACSKLQVSGVVIGEGPERTELEERYTNIEFTGWLDKAEINNYFSKARCCVFPSLCYETQGLSAIEALQAGIPVIAADRNAASEFVHDNINGKLFETGNLASLVECMEALSDSQLVSELSIKAYEDAKKAAQGKTTYIQAWKNCLATIL